MTAHPWVNLRSKKPGYIYDALIVTDNVILLMRGKL